MNPKYDPRYADWAVVYIEETSGKLDHMPDNVKSGDSDSDYGEGTDNR